MSKKPQAGEWWINKRNASPVYVVGMDPEGDTVYMDNPEDKANVDLVDDFIDEHDHEPDCTGWDWKPETFPQYWSTPSKHYAYLIRINAKRCCLVDKKGNQLADQPWYDKTDRAGRTQITKEEAFALLDPPTPVESPDDWVEITHTHPDHVPRVGIDWFTTRDNPLDSSLWVKQESYHTKKTVAMFLKESKGRHKCRRKDLPPITPPKPAMRTVTLNQWIVWDDEGEESEQWRADTPSDCWYNQYKTGQTKTVEVPVDVRPD